MLHGATPSTLAARSKSWTVFARSNAGIVGSNLNQGVNVCLCLRLFRVCVVLRVGSGLATGWSLVQDLCKNDYETEEEARAQQRGVEPLMMMMMMMMMMMTTTRSHTPGDSRPTVHSHLPENFQSQEIWCGFLDGCDECMTRIFMRFAAYALLSETVSQFHVSCVC
jgi:hypothetical protein